MMLKNAHAVFSTPELVLLVAEHLTPYDLAQCNLVCKAWSSHFEPILWTDLDFNREHDVLFDDASFKAALIRNLAHIRTIGTWTADETLFQVLTQGSATSPSALCDNLKEFRLRDADYEHLDETSDYVATLLDLNHRLTDLELPLEFFMNEAVQASVSKLNDLQRLTITALRQCEGNRAISALLQACLPLPNLTELLIDLDLIWDDTKHAIAALTTLIKEASIARFSRHPSATKIKSLQLPDNRHGHGNPLPLLLLMSNLLDLERCEIPWFGESTDVSKLTEVVRKYCPNLKDLTFRSEEEGGHGVCAFIRGCSGLQRFSSLNFSDDLDSEPRGILATLASQHSDTLEVLDLVLCHQVYSRDQQAILSLCKRLKRFWVVNGSQHDDDIGIQSTDILRGDWVCMELIELGLTLNRFPIMDAESSELGEQIQEAVDDKDAEDAEKRLLASASKRIYTQIGRLTKLQVLSLDIAAGHETNAEEGDYQWDLTLSKGWLGEMAGLKSLKGLILEGDLWSEMGQAEVEFIHEHWPLLRQITLRGNIIELSAQSPWLWLLNRRPQLRLLVGS